MPAQRPGRARRRGHERGRTRDRRRTGPRGHVRLRHGPQQRDRRAIGARVAGDHRADARADAGRRRHRPRAPRRPLRAGAGGGAGQDDRGTARPPRPTRQRHLRRRSLRGVGRPIVGARPQGRPENAAHGDRDPPDHQRHRDPAAAQNRRRSARRSDRRHLRGERDTPPRSGLLLRPGQGERRSDRHRSGRRARRVARGRARRHPRVAALRADARPLPGQ
jgi:hypothetical protein